MNNAIFMTLLACVLQAWGGRNLATAFHQYQARQFGRQFFNVLALGLLMALGPFFVLIPVWQTFGQPIFIVVEVVVLVASFALVAFVPDPLLSRFIGPRTYFVWLSLILFAAALYIVNQVWDDRLSMASCFFILGFLALAYGLRVLLKKAATTL